MKIPGSEKTWLKIDGVLLIAFFITMVLLTGWVKATEVYWTHYVGGTGLDSVFFYAFDQSDGSLSASGAVEATDNQVQLQIPLDNTNDYTITLMYKWDSGADTSYSYHTAKYIGGVTSVSSATVNEIAQRVVDSATTNPAVFLGGAGTGSGACYLYYEAPDGTAINDVEVTCRTDAGVLQGYNETGTDGMVSFNLDPGDYVFYAKKAAYYWADTAITVATTIDDTMIGTAFNPTSPGTSNTCMCYFYLYDIHGVAVYGQTVTITLPGEVMDTCSGVTIGQSPYYRTTDIYGYFEVPLTYSSCLYNGGSSTIKYKLTIKGDTKKEYEFEVPDSTQYKLVF